MRCNKTPWSHSHCFPISFAGQPDLLWPWYSLVSGCFWERNFSRCFWVRVFSRRFRDRIFSGSFRVRAVCCHLWIGVFCLGVQEKQTPTEKMPDSIALGEGMCYIARRGMAIRVNTLCPDYSIKRLKCFGSKKNSRAKTTDVSWEMHNDVKFGFVEPAVCPPCRTQEKVFNLCGQEGLELV